MPEKFGSLEDLIRELEDEGHDLRRVIVDKSRVLIPREDDEEEQPTNVVLGEVVRTRHHVKNENHVDKLSIR